MQYTKFGNQSFTSLIFAEKTLYTDDPMTRFVPGTTVTDEDGCSWVVLDVQPVRHPEHDALSRVRLVQLTDEA